MADDEVPSLAEMGLFDVPASAFSVPGTQIGRLPRAMPVWYGIQRRVLAFLPQSELGFRIPSLICAVLTSALAFLVSARWRGVWFAGALAIVLNGSQLFVFLAQINRFYSMPLLLLALTFIAMLAPRGGPVMITITGLLTVLTVLSHNLTVAVFVLTLLAAAAAYVLGQASRALIWRTGTAAAVSVLVYFAYLRPLVSGWASTGNPTPPLVSFAAHAGVPILALALLGGWLAVMRKDNGQPMLWWALLFAGGLCFIALAPVSWNPRYFIFFMPAMWVLAAHAMEVMARHLGYGTVGPAWYACVVLLLLPNLASHFRDGSRHDYRAAARVLEQHARAGQPLLSDDAETISFYLPASLRETLQVRTKVRELPAAEFFLVTRANVWTPWPRTPGRDWELLAEIYERRYDQFSHVLRVFRVKSAQHD